MNQPRFKNGKVATDGDLEIIARAFGFTSAQHLNEVMAGTAPSGLESQQAFQRRRAHDRAEDTRRQVTASLTEIERRDAERRADMEAAQRKSAERSQTSRQARYAVLARKRAEAERAETERAAS